MQDVIGFCFGFIAVGMGIMGLFVIFSSILSEKDDKVQQAFRDGFVAGIYKDGRYPTDPRELKDISKK